MPTHRQAIGRYGALKSWSQTVDRSARTRPARAKSPSSIEYHLERLGPEFEKASHAQRLDAAEAAKKAYFAELTMKSVRARRKGVSGDEAAA